MHVVVNTLLTLQWSNVLSSTVDLHYSTDQVNWNVIELDAEYTAGPDPEQGQGQYVWPVPEGLIGRIYVRVTDHEEPDITLAQLVYVVTEEKALGSTIRLQWSNIASENVWLRYQIEENELVTLPEPVANLNGSDPEQGQGYYDFLLETECSSVVFQVIDTDESDMFATSDPVAVIELTDIDVTTELECQTSVSANGTLYLDAEMESGVSTDISANGTLYMDVESESRCDTEVAVNGTLYLNVETKCGCRSYVKGNKKIKSKSHSTHVSVSVGI